MYVTITYSPLWYSPSTILNTACVHGFESTSAMFIAYGRLNSSFVYLC